jgi:hypothetical protein
MSNHLKRIYILTAVASFFSFLTLVLFLLQSRGILTKMDNAIEQEAAASRFQVLSSSLLFEKPENQITNATLFADQKSENLFLAGEMVILRENTEPVTMQVSATREILVEKHRSKLFQFASSDRNASISLCGLEGSRRCETSLIQSTTGQAVPITIELVNGALWAETDVSFPQSPSTTHGSFVTNPIKVTSAIQ